MNLQSSLDNLIQFDTPTICNALELIEPQRRGYGYTTRNMTGLNSAAGPVAGVAMTATMRSAHAAELSGDRLKEERLKYYEYMFADVGATKVCVMQDLDGEESGKGPFWGEFNTRIHRAMGFRAVVTDGTVRDVAKLPQDVLVLSRGLRPSHAYVHVVAFGVQVNVFGMVVSHGDIVHADEHGAVAFPAEWAATVAERASEFMASEAPIIEACKAERLDLDELLKLYMSR
jgi:regulator of RNase E activity RraA